MEENIRTSSAKLNTIELAGFEIINTSAVSLLDMLNVNRQSNKKTILFFANSNFIVNCRSLFKQYEHALKNVIIVNDGVALNIAAKIVHGQSFQQNLNGTDFSPFLLDHLSEPVKIYLLGAKPEVVVKAKNFIDHRFSKHTVVGYQDGYFDHAQSNTVINNINSSGAHVLFVAMGNPIQEQWILQHQHALSADYILGVGALFDFWSGNKVRAPLIVQKLRLEWLFRLCQEPRRLFKRYTFDMFKFLYIVVRYSNKKT